MVKGWRPPLGLEVPIAEGGLFPNVGIAAERTVQELDSLQPCAKNHASFAMDHGEKVSPAWALLTDQVTSGFTLLFKDVDRAE